MPTWLEAVSAVDPGTEVLPGVTAADLRYAMTPGPLDGLRHGTASYVGGCVDWYAPESAGPHPGVVLVHGGSWSSGDRTMHRRHARDLAARGYVAATIDYRLVPAVPWRTTLADVRAAVDWLRSEPGVDPDRVAVAGGSAGGHLAALTALAEDSPVVGAVLWYPPVRLRSAFARPDFGVLVVAAFGDDLDVASPVNHVRPGAPPVLTMTGDGDPVLPLPDARAFHGLLTAAGVPNDLVVYDDPRHGFDLTERWYDDCFARMAAFLDSVTRPR